MTVMEISQYYRKTGKLPKSYFKDPKSKSLSAKHVDSRSPQNLEAHMHILESS